MKQENSFFFDLNHLPQEDSAINPQKNSETPRTLEEVLAVLRTMVTIVEYEGRKVVALDLGSSSLRFAFSHCNDEKACPWINMPTEMIDFEGRQVNCMVDKNLEAFIQSIILVVQECQLKPGDVLALTGFTNSLVVVGKDGQAVTLLDDPSYEDPYTPELEAILDKFGFGDSIKQRFKDKKHSSLAKLLALIKDPQAFLNHFALEEDFFDSPEDVHFSSFQGYLVSRLFELEFGRTAESDWKAFGSPELAQMQALLLEHGFPPQAILEVYANEFQPTPDSPLVCSVVDFLAEIDAVGWVIKERSSKTAEKTVAIATDSVGKFLVAEVVEGLKNLPDQGVSYLTQRLLGNGYRLVRDMINNYHLYDEEVYAGSAAGINHYRETDRIVSEHLARIREEGLESYQQRVSFYPQEDGNYTLINQAGEKCNIEELAAELYAQGGRPALEQFVFEIINGIGFSIREKLLFIEEKLNNNVELTSEEKQNLTVLFYGGMAAHSFSDSNNEWGNGFVEALVASLPAYVKAAILQLQNAAQAVVISQAKKHQIPYDGELEITQINHPTGILESVYQNWGEILQTLLDQGALTKNEQACLFPATV